LEEPGGGPRIYEGGEKVKGMEMEAVKKNSERNGSVWGKRTEPEVQ